MKFWKCVYYSGEIRIDGLKRSYLSVLQNYHLAQATHETQVKLVKCKESCMDWKRKDQNETGGETLEMTSNNQRRHLAMLWIRAAATQRREAFSRSHSWQGVDFITVGRQEKKKRAPEKKGMWFFEILSDFFRLLFLTDDNWEKMNHAETRRVKTADSRA